MKILVIHNFYQQKGGEDIVVQQEIELLRDKGHIVDTFFVSNKSITTQIDKFTASLNTSYSVKFRDRIKKKINYFCPDIVHIHNTFPIITSSVYDACIQSNVPSIQTLHNFRIRCSSGLFFRDGKICEQCLNKSAFQAVLHKCYRNSIVGSFFVAKMIEDNKRRDVWNVKVDRLISLTSFAKQKLIASGIKKNKICIKPNFIKDYGYCYEKEDYFLFIGRLSVEKGLDLLLEVFTKTDKKLKIIGTGPLENEVHKSVSTNPNIEYLGFMNKDAIINHLKKAKSLIFSSICYEGMPMTILESFSTGTPVISPNIGGPNEMVKNNENGLIYEVNNSKDLLDKIYSLDEDRELQNKLSNGARSSYKLNYSAELNYKMLMDIYKKVIDEKA